jgi:hypothetical protein
LEDNTVSVFEPPVANSGIPGGPFFKRRPAKVSPRNGAWAYLRGADFVVGAVIEISGRTFRLNGADEATFALMEMRTDEFPLSDFEKVLGRAVDTIKRVGRRSRDALRHAAASEDIKLAGGGAMVLSRASFIDVLTRAACGLDLCAQSLVTLWRGFPKKRIDPLQTRAPEALKRTGGEDAEYVDVETLFEALNVPWVEGREEEHATRET